MANKRVTQLNECAGLADTDMFMIDCETNGTRRVSAEKLKEYVGSGGGNSVYFSEEEPTDAKTGDFWYDESEDDTSQLSLLIETDMLPAVYNADGKILTDENGKIILRY